ncbi:MAG: DUF4139 domain-containing protein [Candidatus Zixiibacteriota bacterium]|nr:MAG: DUF4139 domain-containing protein [candidate division Zixibacteria bacterium]
MNLLRIVFWVLALPTVLLADEIAVTIYNSNLGVVSETRTLQFEKGVHRLAFRDVPSQIDASSVRFDIEGPGGKAAILEQNYAFDLVSPEQMYKKYIDNEIELIDKEGRLYSGTLLAYSGGAVTLREKSGRVKIVQMANITEVNFPSLPEGLITRPTLFWLYTSDFDGQLDCRVSYQTTGMIWTAEYVGVLSSNEKMLDLSGWSSINNTSGKTYADATLKLVAGDIHRARPKKLPRGVPDALSLAAGAMAKGFEEKAFFEYHLYTLPRKTTLADKEMKQISLFEPAETVVEKVFIYKPERNPKNVEVALKFQNSAQAGLGLPLPAGRVRLFKADDDGSLILLGEDWIEHTPKDEKLNLKVGYAFDIAAEERLMDQTRISKQVEERDYEIELRNRKEQAITVEVEKKLYGFWEVIEANFAYTKKDANTLTFEIPVDAGETVVLKYKVRFTLR